MTTSRPTRQELMIAAFAAYESSDPATLGPLHNLIGVPIGTRLLRIYRRKGYWQLWIATNDYVFGTYYRLWDNGKCENVTEFMDEGPREFQFRPTDEEIRSGQ